ncbi:bestrophin family protein [Chryseobacterium binzhouense]|uniref:bestrophin family protein n=1 Tax=Chryseobacterium binzhouense TaxID=2593646 RepID=UPI0028A0E87B|nr:bestrophin family ion channel [Chryseobacterium binzhouense]
MILKKIFNPLAVIRYLKTELFVSALLASLVFVSYSFFGIHKISLPFSIAAILGSALAIFIAFRNQSSYARWWEARTLWGGIVNSSRVFARLVRTFADSHKHQPNYDQERSEKFKKETIFMQIAWVHALRLHLRKENNWDILKKYLSETDYTQLLKANNKPNYLQTLQCEKIYEAMSNGTLGGFDSFQMEGQLLALANYQGGCERIKNTPLLRQYHFFTKLFLTVFMLVLPFSLVGDFVKMDIGFLVIPLSVLISFVFATMAKVGEVNEEPFENKITDVPLSALCNTIERDLLETLNIEPLPEKLEPKDGYLF